MEYKLFFSLDIVHRYYQGRFCADFDIEPTVTCWRILRGHRLVPKFTGHGLQVWVPVQPNSLEPVISLADTTAFTFVLKLKNPDFVNFTELDSNYRPHRHLYKFKNDPQEVSATVRELEPSLIPRDTRSITSSFEISEHPQLARTTFGLVELHYNAALSQSPSFEITFPPRQQTWAYYLVVNARDGAKTYSIQQKDSGQTVSQVLRFSEPEVDPNDRVATSLKQRFPQSKILRLRSDQPVPCRELGRPDLQLLKHISRGRNSNSNSNSNQVWIANLPNPPNHHGTQVVNLLEDI
jgi:hypothetical protein